MAEFNPQDAYLLEKVVDPNSAEFKHLMSLLVKPIDDGRSRSERLRSKKEWKYTFPFKGDPESEQQVSSLLPYRFAERGVYRNGVASLALSLADVIDLVELSSSRHRVTTSLCVTSESDVIQQTLATAGGMSTLVYYASADSFTTLAIATRPEVLIVDHTTVNMPIDEVLNTAYRLGAKVVDGVFPFHVAALKGWDVVTGIGRWSYTHSRGLVTIGPDDDCSRMVQYATLQYKKFLDPNLWHGNSRQYGYEIRKMKNGLATYRAVYLGESAQLPTKDTLQYSLPVCSSEDMVLITINRELAAGVFASRSNNAHELARLDRDYAIEVRRELFNTCVDYLISKDRGADLVGDAVRYVTQHNYVDLVDGLRIVRCASLSYADALCVSMVCALTAFQLRYRLTNESIPDIQRSLTAARLAHDAPFGALGRLAWLCYTYVSDNVYNLATRALTRAKEILYSTDKIPGVCYDVYTTVTYSPDLVWFEPYNAVVEDGGVPTKSDHTPDPITGFLGAAEKTSAPTVTFSKEAPPKVVDISETPYVANPVPDPWVSLQHVYDEVLPGNSTTQIQAAAELTRVRDVNVNTQFHGKIEVNKDVKAPERLPADMPIRTSAIQSATTPLLDNILASAKRNFNPPDLQMQSDPWAYAKYLADKFVDWAFVPNFRKTIGAAYVKDPLTFNVLDYLEWRFTRHPSYLSALEAECPNEIAELGLEKFDLIIKKRVKPKLSTSAQYELAQPQVIVASRKTDTALFSSIFRKCFERFDHALRREICSAGRLSDDQISTWLTEQLHIIMATEAVELDSTKFDKSQGLLARMVEAYILLELGLDPQVMEIFGDSYVGRVSSQAIGLTFTSAYQMKSGDPHTMLGNILYNSISAMESIGPHNIRLMIVKGDDNVVWLMPNVDRQLVVSKMSGLFNLEVKLISSNVLYFSSGYILPMVGKAYFAPDPIKIVELLGEPTSDPRTLAEQFISFQDRIRSLTLDHQIPATLQAAVRARMSSPSADVILAIDSLVAVAKNYKTFEHIKRPRS